MKRLLPLLLVLAAACGDDGASKPPEVGELTLTTAEDTPATKALPITDADKLTITFGTPAHGTLTHTGASVTYTPAENYNGTDSVSVKVSNGSDDVNTTLAITVTPVNDAPIAGDDALAAQRNTTLVAQTSMLLANDTDIDGDTLAVTAVSAASMGTVALGGTTVTYTPPAGYTGTATFAYTLSDGTVNATGTVTITISGANAAPVAVDDTATTAEDTALALTSAMLVANDTDADGQSLSVMSVSGATHGTAVLAGTTVTFTPDANYNGAAKFEYVVTDGSATDTGTVNITVTPVNDGPVANNDVASTPRNTALALTAATLLANDTDVDGPALTLTAVSSPTHGTVALAGATVTFTPATDFTGTASFVYTVSDGTLTDTATVTVNVTTTNVAPVAIDDTATTAEDTALTITAASLALNDTDADGDMLVVTAVANATHGTVVLAAGTITFTPAANYNGAASFTYTVSDGTATDTGLVAITVTPVNDAPVAVDDTASTTLDTAIVITAATLTTNDTDAENDALTITAVGNATNGTVALAGTDITFTPATAFVGTATFEYTVSDGALTDVGLVSVSVGAVCGNSAIEGTETCDDGNTTPGDGCSATCQDESLVAFTFTNAAGGETSIVADTVSSLLTSPIAFTRGTGISGVAAPNTFNSSGWTQGTAIDPADYVTFTVGPQTGNLLTMTTLRFSLQRSLSGPDLWAVRSSLDDYATDVQTGTLTTSGAPQVPFSLTLGAPFANLTAPVTFRFYGYHSSTAGGTLRFDNVSVLGTVGP